jgi:hypothetical protein
VPETTDFPPITILIPAYNLQDYIADAIRCAASQEYPGGLQIVVLDDGSTDNTLETARRIASGYSNVQVHTQTNQGRVGARNQLLTLAATEWIAWIDGDDMAPPTWIREQVLLMLGSSDLVAVSGQGYAMTAHGLPIGPIDRPLSHAEIERAHLCGHSNAFFQSCTVVSRSAVLAVGGYRPDFSASEDFDLWLRLAEIGQLANHAQRHLYYRVHSTSANATLGREQQRQGQAATNMARLRRGLVPLNSSTPAFPPSLPRADWNRQIYWVNIAMKSGNPWTAAGLTCSSLFKHPFSLLLWLMLCVAMCDTLMQLGNRTCRFRAGHANQFGTLGSASVYRVARRIVHLKRNLWPNGLATHVSQ